jgi:uncharacterized protein (TIGR02687 family)
MKAAQVDEALTRKFVNEGHRLVFWHDSDHEFADYVTAGETDGLAGELANVQILDVNAVGGLSAKLQLEREDTRGQYLVYSHGERMPAEHDWLLDVRLYSGQFQADVASIWLQELGLNRLALCDHLRARTAFLKSAERRRKLTGLLSTDDDERALDLKMLAVLTGSPVATVFDVLMALCDKHVVDGVFALDDEPAALANLRKKGLDDAFWQCMQDEFSYTAEEPSIAGLLRCLLVTELLGTLEGEALSSVAQFRLPTRQRQASVFLTQWRDSASRGQSYDAVADVVAEDLAMQSLLEPLEWRVVVSVPTFLLVEKMVVGGLRDELLAEVRPSQDEILSVASVRSEGHWLSSAHGDEPERAALAAAYRAIGAAARLFDLLDQVGQWLQSGDAEELLAGYRDQWHEVDQQYRIFHTYAAPAASQGWNLLKSLAESVEGRYDQQFEQPLGVSWSALLDQGFLQQWLSTSLPPQQRFYQRVIAPYLAESPKRRAFVIISDAMRFEVASELRDLVNGRYRYEAQLSGMLGVLPSYTGLGMASLLPHDRLDYNARGEVLADGASTAAGNRTNVLAGVQGIACTAKELEAMKKQEARDFVSGHRVVYIYHNEIDAVGDTASTEAGTFDAVTRALDQVAKAVRRCVDDLNATRVWVTADHGFLFQMAAPVATDRSKLLDKPEKTLKHKKRYVIGQSLNANPAAHCGSTATTAGTTDSVDFWIPRGANRFHFTGGARFVHGGAMPQEVVVPLLAISEISGKKKAATKVGKVGVQVLGNRHRVTTPSCRFDLIQTEAVSDRRKAVTLRVALYEDDQPVSSVERLVFDSASANTEDRQRSVRLELRAGTFDKRTPYFLRLHDTETERELCAVPVVIDRSFSFDDDF